MLMAAPLRGGFTASHVVGNGLIYCALVSFLFRRQQRCAPGACAQKSTEEDDGIDAGASLGSPVDIFQVEPEGEFIEGEGGADSIEDRHKAAEKNGRVVAARADLGEPSIADEKENEDAEDEVVDVAPSVVDEVEGRDVMEDGVNDGANRGESEEEADGGNKEALAGTLGNPFANQLTEWCALQKQKEQGSSGERKQKNKPGIFHAKH